MDERVVERVARTLAATAAEMDGEEYCTYAESPSAWRRLARAAIAAMQGDGDG